MKIKRLIILLTIFLLTGCNATYTLTLNEDSSVAEQTTIYIENSDENYRKINKLLDNEEIDKKNYKIVRESNEIKISYNNKYNNIDSYVLNSYIYKQLFENIDLNKGSNNIKLSTDVDLSKNNISINKDKIYDFDEIKINIDSKLPVISSNADSVNENIYTWNINKDNLGKNINIKYNRVPSEVTIRAIVVISLIIISTGIIALIIYRRTKQMQRI